MADTVILTRTQYESLAGPITLEERRKYNGWEAALAITDCLLNRRKTGTKQGGEMKLTQSERKAPALDAGLVKQMQDAWQKDAGDYTECMTAALQVAADALLGLVAQYLDTQCGYSKSGQEHACNWIRARLLAPAKSAEERVTVEYVSACDTFGWKVFADNDERALFKSERDAEIYRLGLIATLKQEGK